MALLFCDSFDHYTTLANKYTSNLNSSIGTGRFGNGLSLNFINSYAFQLLSANYDTLIFGAAINWPTAQDSDRRLFSLFDSVGEQVSLRLHAGLRTLYASRNGTNLAFAPTNTMLASTWQYVEVAFSIADAGGTVVANVDGTQVINFTGDTKGQAGATADRFFIGDTPNGNGTLAVDDFVLMDDVDSGVVGAPNNAFLGDVRVEARFPNGNGNSSQWVGSDANSTDNYLLVDETVPNSDTDYVEAATVGEKDTYTFQDLTPTSGSVYGVQIIPWARKTNAGVKKFVSVARLSATETDSAEKTLSTTYQYLPDIRQAKPGGGAWSISDVNSAEFGAKVST